MKNKWETIGLIWGLWCIVIGAVALYYGITKTSIFFLVIGTANLFIGVFYLFYNAGVLYERSKQK